MRLVDPYDAVLFDLDGVIYLGPRAIKGVPETLQKLRAQQVRVGFVTNNAARTPEVVATHLRELGITAQSSDVVNSTMATLRMLTTELPSGARILPVGATALAEQVAAAGFTVVHTREEQPAAVVQGYDPRLDWRLLEVGALAIQDGARWFVTNPDLTRPTDEGIVPGCGAQVEAIRVCVDVEPSIAGKPYPPLLVETVERLGATRPMFVGDRIDTDILGANNVGMASLFVFTGAHGKYDLAAAQPQQRPTAIGYDISALLAEPRTATIHDGTWQCGSQQAGIAQGQGAVLSTPSGREEQLDALWALLQLAWNDGVDITAALEQLDEVH